MKAIITSILILTFAVFEAFATTYHVSPEGSDLNPGTEEQPFRSIPKALQLLQYSGGTCIIHEGVYRTTISLKNYNKEIPLQIIAAPGEHVDMDGREEITSAWTHHEGGIWKCSITGNMEQVL